MADRSTFRWFVRGFGLTMLVGLAVIAVFRPGMGLAQEGQGNLATGLPAGVQGAASLGKTDDPLGRTLIPLPENPEPTSNLEAGSEERNPTAALSAEEATRLQEKSPQLESSPLVIPAADFRDDGVVPNSHMFEFSGGYQRGTEAAYGCMMAPAYLPDGVEITEFFASVYDHDPDAFLWANLWRVNNFSGAVDVMAGASTEGMSPGEGIIVLRDTIDFDLSSVLYPDYSYYVTTCIISPNLRLYSVRLYFSP